MKKTAFLINSMAGGGAERVVSILLKNLSRENREFFLIVLEDKFYYQIPQDVKVIKLNSKFFGFLKLKKIIKRNEIDLVFSFLGRSNYNNILAKLLGSKHQAYINERINPSRMHLGVSFKASLNRFLLKRLYKKADLILSNSLGIRNSLNQDFNLPLDKIKVIYNPIDLEKIREFCQNDLEPKYQEIFKNPVIINIARLTKQKGQEYLIRAFKIVADQIQGAKLLILGEGERERYLKYLVKKLDLENDVLFLGWQKNPFKFLAKAKVFVLSSLWEGFPNTLIEALACGIPAISTDCPSGPDEIIENAKSGLLVPVKDEKALSQAMIKILEYPITANYFSKQGKERANDFSIERIIKQYERII
jgi:glycosyltransferase involved in cell wall biosynthesis